MSVLLLTNHHPQALYPCISFDCHTGFFLQKNGKKISKEKLLQTGFAHPLLQEKSLPLIQEKYCYFYDDDQAFMLALRFIYATLLQVKRPKNCQFKIQPSENYPRPPPYKFNFSINEKKTSTESIDGLALSELVKTRSGNSFVYLNALSLEDTITLAHLPKKIDAELLFQRDFKDDFFANHQAEINRCELRYINQGIGFGLFAKTSFSKGEVITFYAGKLSASNTGAYAFTWDDNLGFNLFTDAQYQGNISRFINHSYTKAKKEMLSANVQAYKKNIFGNNVITFIAARDIKKGEQFLLNYGKAYFRKHKGFRIKKDGKIMDVQQNIIQDDVADRHKSIQMFSEIGIRQAQWTLIKKTLTGFYCLHADGIIFFFKVRQFMNLSQNKIMALMKAIALIQNEKEAFHFFADLCTPAELEAMADRWQVVRFLKEDMPYRTIHEHTGVSVATITRVARSLNLGSGGYKLISDRGEKKRNEDKSRTI